jgi:hypothetical protein
MFLQSPNQKFSASLGIFFPNNYQNINEPLMEQIFGPHFFLLKFI